MQYYLKAECSANLVEECSARGNAVRGMLLLRAGTTALQVGNDAGGDGQAYRAPSGGWTRQLKTR
ncbi:MAG: hypothetical protein IJT35_08335 [Paludibacteraceae bacterium]|nr:hypothetical protein [Paludibacteraceae bacterium]